MKIICVEEHAIDPATDKAARPAVLGEAPYFGLMDSPRGADRIIWSVDYPYLALDGTREFLGKLPVSEQDREKIAHVNAAKLFTL
jgi:uncharacterized protein